MKILNEQSMVVSHEGTIDRPDNIRNVNELSPGERFKATVTDIQQGRVTIRLDSGQMLTAKSLVLPEARIGEDSIFLVTENFKGQILLEMVKPDDNAAQISFVKEALTGAGQPATKENIELVRALMERQLPIDRETIQKALFFKYAQGEGETLSLDRVLFLVEENFPADKMNIELLNNIMEKQVGLKENISSLMYEILDIPDTALQKQLLLRLVGSEALASAGGQDRGQFVLPEQEAHLDAPVQNESQMEVINLAKEKLYFHLDKEKSVEDLQRYFKEVYEAARDMQKLLDNTAVKPEAVIQRLAAIQENLEFMNHIGQYRNYMQLPFTLENRENEGELIIFKNPAKGTNNYEKQASVLIGLDYAYLGRVEVFINKLNNTLSLQFRMDKDDTLKTVNQNFHKLAAGLSEKGYLVTGVAFKKLTQPFQITARGEAPAKAEKPARRYSFDMRV